MRIAGSWLSAMALTIKVELRREKQVERSSGMWYTRSICESIYRYRLEMLLFVLSSIVWLVIFASHI